MEACFLQRHIKAVSLLATRLAKAKARLLCDIEHQATQFRKQFAAEELARWQDAQRIEAITIRKKNREDQKALIAKELLRKERYARRLWDAEIRYLEALEVMAEWQGRKGTKPHYASPEEARAARQRYKAAYGTVFNRTLMGKVNSRLGDKRLRQDKIRSKRPPGMADFYRRMLTEPQSCFYCEKALSLIEREADHYIPLAKSGAHQVWNLVVACPRCNGRKSDLMPDEFWELLNSG